MGFFGFLSLAVGQLTKVSWISYTGLQKKNTSKGIIWHYYRKNLWVTFCLQHPGSIFGGSVLDFASDFMDESR